MIGHGSRPANETSPVTDTIGPIGHLVRTRALAFLLDRKIVDESGPEEVMMFWRASDLGSDPSRLRCAGFFWQYRNAKRGQAYEIALQPIK